jgi:hypothetical protein
MTNEKMMPRCAEKKTSIWSLERQLVEQTLDKGIKKLINA